MLRRKAMMLKMTICSVALPANYAHWQRNASGI
jgi:hypothetical protein